MPLELADRMPGCMLDAVMEGFCGEFCVQQPVRSVSSDLELLAFHSDAVRSSRERKCQST